LGCNIHLFKLFGKESIEAIRTMNLEDVDNKSKDYAGKMGSRK
jgi:hypothetical protein